MNEYHNPEGWYQNYAAFKKLISTIAITSQTEANRDSMKIDKAEE
jgi:hypothetical protein